MKILIVAPLTGGLVTGNQVTAERWAGIIRELGHDVEISDHLSGDCDLLIALHAFRSHSAVREFRARNANRPVIVALTGTDLYRDLKVRSETSHSLRLATSIVALQRKAIEVLPSELHSKVVVIFQSARPPHPFPAPDPPFQVCVAAHFRKEKDPLRAALAVRDLPSSSRIRVTHFGRVLEGEMQDEVQRESLNNSRYEWRGEVSHEEALTALASSHLVVISSLMEGSSNTLSEALACGVPVLASRIPGLIGTLEEDYPGFFPVGDTGKLRELLLRCEQEPEFLSDLKSRVETLASLVDPKRERNCWRNLLQSVAPADGTF